MKDKDKVQKMKPENALKTWIRCSLVKVKQLGTRKFDRNGRACTWILQVEIVKT
jgi:hypothetical protein